MEVSKIIAELDSQISKLQQARALLAGTEVVAAADKPRRGRPKGSKNATTKVPTKAPAVAKKAKRELTPEGRKAIADAMKRRWAARRSATAS
ncbi:hypothetical protein SAMN05421770_103286 [Granulicella rosea]|uniref:Uncharacterized protein n=1 Tax=Granulicella rosea TaxID=474952 RepID=A0A239IUD0_9BACT|nr:hypothetical protein [Granulicella rosea]SNS97201.1 hypothetical protein SAMN05421770_103286 [Granulicella rosea]